MRRKLKIISILFFCVFAGYAIGGLAYLSRFPAEIRVTEFSTHRLSFGLPLSATFHETAAVAKINDTPLSEISGVRLGRPLTIQTAEHGTAEFTIGAFGFPFRRITLDVVPEVEVIPLGLSIGVRINTEGVMILGTSAFEGACGKNVSPSLELLRGGDLIIGANGTEIRYKEELGEYVANSDGEIVFLVRRDDEEIFVTIEPKADAKYGVRRIGAWVRDSTKGIGTLTFLNPETGEFGALGHGILDVDTKMLLSVRSGNIMPSSVTSVNRGMRGMPGELEGQVDISTSLGTITTNCPNGIFGELDSAAIGDFENRPRLPIARRAQIVEGRATILANVSGTEVREYEIEIENINLNPADETKGIVIRITDADLLRITGGIVQGMSGSPILQNGRVVGAITHVFVQDPTKGYAIFIENMIRYCPESYAVYALAA